MDHSVCCLSINGSTNSVVNYRFHNILTRGGTNPSVEDVRVSQQSYDRTMVDGVCELPGRRVLAKNSCFL